MAIKGLTDRNLSFPEIGQIRKGSPKPNESQPGKDLTYFRATFDEREQEAEATFHQVYGNEPTEINVILPFNEIERCWDPFLEAYTAGRLVARSDGERYIYRVDVQTGQVVVKDSKPFMPYAAGEVIGTWTNRKIGKEEPIVCRPVGRLKVIVPELARAAYITVMTTSIHDIANISAQLQAFKSVNGGRIAGIPLKLRRRPKKISSPTADGKRARYTKWMLSIEADPEWVKQLLLETKRLALPGNGLALLPGGDAQHEEPEEEVTETSAAYMDDDDWDPAEEKYGSMADAEPAEPEFVEAAAAAPTEQAATMTLAEAEAITNSEGVPYGKIPTDKLAHMANSLAKLTGDRRTPEHDHKAAAIAVILAARASKGD